MSVRGKISSALGAVLLIVLLLGSIVSAFLAVAYAVVAVFAGIAFLGVAIVGALPFAFLVVVTWGPLSLIADYFEDLKNGGIETEEEGPEQ